MKMTDVITALRDVNPRLQESFAGLNGPLAKAISLINDADSCRGDEARKALEGRPEPVEPCGHGEIRRVDAERDRPRVME